jgi:acyl-CoA synthetase (AMP-forming)/AMP-acid ligase II
VHTIEFFDRGARLYGDRPAFVNPDRSEVVTYAEAEALTHRVAAALHARGLCDGTPVGILSPNTPWLFPHVLGVLRSGCTWVALNARSATSDLADLLGLVGARALLFAGEMTEVADELVVSVPTLETAIEIGAAERDWLAPAGATVELPPLDPETVAAYFGTGGTTGRAKAVTVPIRSFETMIHAFNAHMPEPDPPVNLVAAPLTHAAGAALFPVLSLGGTNVIHGAVVPDELLTSLERNRVTRLFLPPTAIYALLGHPPVREFDTSSLRYFLYGAAPMSVDKLIEAIDVFGPVMTQFFGQTELPMLCTFFAPEEHAEALADPTKRGRLASCGRPTTVANVVTMDEAGAICPVGERGEIVVRSALQMSGYHDDPEQTEAIAREGGWLATGDIGYFDEDGYLYLVDRKRDLIITGGFNVFPSEVEQVIWGHAKVGDCAVIGLPDEKWGERVTAVVELKESDAGSDELGAEIVSLCKERLGSVKAPKEVIFRSLPRSAVGKVLKRELREEYWSGSDRRI